MRPSKPSAATVNRFLTTALRASDMCRESLQLVADAFVDAHVEAPANLSLEVGTREGGSAWLMLSLLGELYVPAERPMLFTVDPYGGKPYAGGDLVARDKLYDKDTYRRARHWLAEFPWHAHYYMTSETFLNALSGETYYSHGEEQVIGHYGFVLLDGDHTAIAIAGELETILQDMAPKGRIVVDNVDKDPDTLRLIGEVVAGRVKVHVLTEGRPKGGAQVLLEMP